MTTNIKTMEITFTRTIPASPEESFDGWLDRTNPGTPWSVADKLILEPKVDALFYFHTNKSDGAGYAHFGRFDLLDRPRKMQYTWMSCFTRGLESVVTVTFQKKGEDTLLTLTHAGLPDDEMGRAHDQGWRHFLGIFEGRFAPALAKEKR